MKKTILFILLIFSASLTIPLVFSQEAEIEQRSETLDIGYSLPEDQYPFVDQGDSHTGAFALWNTGKTSDTYYVYIRGFRQEEEAPGAAIPLSLEEDQEDPYSASQWTKVDRQEVTLEPLKNEEINYEVKVPEDAAYGTYTLMIFFSTENKIDLNSSGTRNNLATGPALLVTVGDQDDLTESAEVLDFYADKKVYFGDIKVKDEVVFTTSVSNKGNTHITPTGSITTYNILDKPVDKVPFVEGNKSILRGNKGTYKSPWYSRLILTESNALNFGPMRSELTMYYANFDPGFKVITASTTFWVVPWPFIAFVLMVIITYVLYRFRQDTKEESDKR